MTETPTRRSILRSTAATGTLGAFTVQTVDGKSVPTIRTVETAVYYDVDVKDNFSTVHLDSRPPYTVDTEQEQLILSKSAPDSLAKGIKRSGAMLNEQPMSKGESVTLASGSASTKTLATSVSTRKRPMQAISLTEALDLPKVTVQRRSTNPRIVLPAGKPIELEPGSDQEIRLDSTRATVKTVEFIEGTGSNDDDGKPRGPDREFGSVEVEVTPIVDIVDHGELAVAHRLLP